MGYQRQVARALINIGAVGFKPRQPVTFVSGIVSPVYVDNRRLPFYPQAWHKVLEGFMALINERKIEFEVIAGIAVGGIPHSSALSFALNYPSVFVRKESKAHGMGKRVEGGGVKNKRVLLVEDLVSTGKSSLSGIQALREEGALVQDCLVIVSYDFKEAQEAFVRAAVTLHALTSFEIVLKEALSLKKLGPEEKIVIEDWFADPHGWAQRQGF